MTDKKFNVHRYQDKLSDIVEDGSGCVETWEALSHNQTPTRRRILKTSVTASLLFTGLNTFPSSALAAGGESDGNVSNVDVLSGDERRSAIAEMQSQDSVRRLIKKASQMGYIPDQDECEAFTTYAKSDALSYATIVIRFKKQGSDRRYDTAANDGSERENSELIQVLLLASGLEDFDPALLKVKYTNDANGDYRIDISESYLSNNGDIVEDSHSITQSDIERRTDDVAAQQNDVGTEVIFGPCGPCPPDIDCITTLAEIYALEIVACGTCVASAGWLNAVCATCIATIIEEDDFGYTCDICIGDSWLC